MINSLWPFPTQTGGKVVGAAVLRSLSRVVDTLHVVGLWRTPVLKKDDFILEIPRIKKLKLVRWQRDKNIFRIPLYWLRKTSYFLTRDNTKDYINTTLSLLKTNDYDLILFERDLALGVAYSLYFHHRKLLANSKLVYISQNVESDIVKGFVKHQFSRVIRWPLGALGYFDSFIYKHFERLLLSNMFDWISSISEEDTTFYKIKYGITNVDTFPPAFYKSTTKRFIDCSEKAKSIRMLATLSWFPNIDGIRFYIKNVWPQVLKYVPDARLYIAGRGASTSLIEELSNIKGVVFAGEIEDQDKYFNEACGVLNVVKGGSGVKIKVLRSIYDLKPMIANYEAVRGIPDGMLKKLDWGDTPEELAKITIKILTDKTYRQSVANKYKKLREKYLFEENLDKYFASLFSRLVRV